MKTNLTRWTLGRRLGLIVVLLLLLPASLLGWLAYDHAIELTKSERIKTVGRVADARYEQLTLVLQRATQRAVGLTADLRQRCASKVDEADCWRGGLRDFLQAEGAVGAALAGPGSLLLTLGESAVAAAQIPSFKPGQLAQLTQREAGVGRHYFIIADDPQAQLRLAITYPITAIQPIFVSHPDLGDSGETFLADGEGFFLSRSRYPSAQGHSHPIAAKPMLRCLTPENAETLDLDYRDVPIIHGFRFVTEIGGGCIMAHIDQAEAFAPLAALKARMLAIMLGFVVFATLAASYFSRWVVQPLRQLTRVTHDIAGGNHAVRAVAGGYTEVVELASAFNAMTDQLVAITAQLEQRVLERTAELQRANTNLVSREEEIRSVVENVADCIISIDEGGIIRSANLAVLKVLGYEVSEVVGQNISLLMPEPHRSAHDAYLERYCRTGEARIIGVGAQVEGLHKNGTQIAMELSITEYFVGGKRFFTGILRDIRERLRVMREMEQARFDAERASRLKSAFLATMSHEIRTPLGGLMGMLELLSLTRLEAAQSETLRTARDSAQSLLRILNDILDWSKIEEGKLELAEQATSIPALVREVLNTYSHVASANGVTLSHQVDAGLSTALLVDPLRLSQVLNNFVSNAIKFSPGGRVEIRAELLACLDDAQQLRLSVQDSGIGMTPQAQQHLFESYGQGSADTARMYGGTGLGLAICRRLADLLDAQIKVQSAPGQGSTFSITLTLPIARSPQPLSQDGAGVSGAACVSTGSAEPVSVDAGAARVLVVDDHPINRKLMLRQLELLGYRADAVENGELALTQWRSGGYALVITDCHMPVLDGYALTRAIRADEASQALARTPVFAWTANALPDEIENCSAAGMDELLIKPTELAQLKAMLAKWLPPTVIADLIRNPVPATTWTPDQVRGDNIPAVDTRVLAALVGDDPATIRELLQDFQVSAQAIAAELLAACAAGDVAQVSAQAHKLKSAARAVGALALGELCAELEAAGKACQSGVLPVLAQRFETEMAGVTRALTENIGADHA